MPARVRREVDIDAVRSSARPTGEGLRVAARRGAVQADEPRCATPAQLAGVDDEPWAETPGCYDENVEAFPRLLRGLASPDPLVREYCLGAID